MGRAREKAPQQVRHMPGSSASDPVRYCRAMKGVASAFLSPSSLSISRTIHAVALLREFPASVEVPKNYSYNIQHLGLGQNYYFPL